MSASSTPMNLPGVVAHSTAMRQVVDDIARAACSPGAGIMLCGEPGTGKSHLARAIHAVFSAPGSRLVEVDCAATGDLESALFGTNRVAQGFRASAQGVLAASERSDSNVPASGERRESKEVRPFDRDGGAATPETVTRDSLLCQAFGGSLVLVNLADMPARLQSRLVRLLRDGEGRIAGNGTVAGPARVIACVEPAFDSLVQEGRVRPDLVKRVGAHRIAVPPLRERREDVPGLVEQFLEASCTALKAGRKALSHPALTLLASLPFHGNSRELRTIVRTLAERTAGATIRLEDVLTNLRLDLVGPAPVQHQGTLREARASFEQQYIREVLERHHGRIPEAARALGIQRTNLYRKMRSVGVRRPRPVSRDADGGGVR